MLELKNKIAEEGKICAGNIVKVDSFLNHQIDVKFLERIGKEFYELYKNTNVNKIVTIETSGVPIAMEVAKCFDCRVVFAKKGKTKNLSDNFYETEVMSYTHGEVYKICLAKEFLGENDNVLLIDDFLANGAALNGLLEIVEKAKANLVGCGVVIEKGFQPGGKNIRKKGIRLESLVIIDKIDEEKQEITFRGE